MSLTLPTEADIKRADTPALLGMMGEALRQERIRRGWSQTDVANRAGCSRQAYSGVELGHETKAGIILCVFRAMGIFPSILEMLASKSVSHEDFERVANSSPARRRVKRGMAS